MDDWKYYPGSFEAREKGCSCPVIDNHYGKGYRGDYQSYIMSDDCKIHGRGYEDPSKPYDGEEVPFSD